MGVINILDQFTANLIAAGEVVERPASAVKELIENSIDAGATKITLEIKSGGKSLIRVTDNGCGFYRDDIPKALLRHATSKISSGDDICGIRSLGFRGEALAAISSVSRTEIITKHKSESIGTRLESDDEAGIVMTDAGCPDGTTICVRDLFYNTPARQRFLKKDSSEGTACIAAAEKEALAHPEIAFTVISDGERRFYTSGDGSLYPAIYSVLGREFASGLRELDYTLENVHIYGYITSPDGARGSRAMQNVFVNGRYVKSRTVQAALEEAFKSYIPRGRYPGCVLFVSLPFEQTDVNVHPAKTEIKFVSERDVFHAVYYGVKSLLETAPDTIITGTETDIPKAEELLFSARREAQKAAEPSAQPVREPVFAAAAQVPEAHKRELFRPNDIGTEDITLPHSVYTVRDSAPVSAPQPDIQPASEPAAPSEDTPPEQAAMFPQESHWRMIGQAYDSYLFVQTDDNVLIIDKHAAHERILYEKLARSKELHIQQLLAGIPIELGEEQAEILLSGSEFLAEKGFDIEDFGRGSIIVRSVPSTLGNVSGLAAIMEDFAKTLASGGDIPFKDRCDRALYTVACKAAMKAGIKNLPEDDRHIVEMLAADPALRFCPHGRPFIKKLPKREIEKFFDR